MSANGRFAVASDPGHETAFPIPMVISTEAEQEFETELRSELLHADFSSRQIAEAVHAYRGYATLTREWNRQHHRALEAEENGDGFRAKAYELLIACRKTGASIKDPQTLDRQAVEQMRAKAAARHDKVTKKITGNWFVMACAVLLKAFLLLPLANSYLMTVLPDAPAMRALVSLILASVLAYTLTFIARYLVQVGVATYGPEGGPKKRSVADILSPKANKVVFLVIFGLFVAVLGAFLSFDFGNAGANGVGVIGLSLLFVAILMVFELFLAYRLYILQDEQPEQLDAVDEVYLQALNRADNETDLAKTRTLTLNAQENWHAFLEMVDLGFNWRRSRRKAMNRVRGMMGIVAEANERMHLNGKAVVKVIDPESISTTPPEVTVQ